jgi:hypothetical protein
LRQWPAELVESLIAIDDQRSHHIAEQIKQLATRERSDD